MKKIKIKTCLDCSAHEIIRDSDPHDWFCDDDVAVICKLSKNPSIKLDSEYVSNRQEFRTSVSSCRPYNLKKEATIPTWCPKILKESYKCV